MRIFGIIFLSFLVSGAAFVTLAAINTTETPDPPRNALQKYLVIGYPMNIPHGYRSDLEKIIYKQQVPQPWLIDTYSKKIDTEMAYPNMRMVAANDYVKGVKTPAVIRVNIDPVPGVVTSNSSDEMRKQIENGTCEANKHGDICLHYLDSMHPYKEAIYLGYGYNFAFCTIDDGRVPSPHCKMNLFLMDEIRIEFFFNRRLFGDVLIIRDRVFARVCSWITWPSGKDANPVGKPLKVNHCR